MLVLEDVEDPYNAAAVFRSCDALGFQTIHLIFEKNKPFDPKEVGRFTATSANKWLDFVVHPNTESCLNHLHEQGFETIATVIEGADESLIEAKLESPDIAILIGNEKRGLSEKAIKLVNRRISIPMRGMMESLNLSVTVSIFLFEITRQRRHLEMGEERFGLALDERQQLTEVFLNKNNVITRRRG
ncbi:MAG: RNA methyltransferase [Thermomicrobiales bacterium]